MYENIIFYSLTGTAFIKISLFKKYNYIVQILFEYFEYQIILVALY